VAVVSFMAAPSVLTLVPLMSRALQLPSSKDEFDQEEDSLIELFSVRSSFLLCVILFGGWDFGGGALFCCMVRDCEFEIFFMEHGYGNGGFVMGYC